VLKPKPRKAVLKTSQHHHIFNLIEGGKLYRAPIDNPGRVLDVGCGTGIWAMDFAEYAPIPAHPS
jgi:ubiquinone/menaquinone biosynthesis C-methylase UbiE